MHKVIQSYVTRFAQENELDDLPDDQKFERFVNFCVISQAYPDDFNIEEVSTGENNDSVDGAAIIIDEQLVLTAGDANSIFGHLKPRQQVDVKYMFVEAKTSEGFDAGDILKFGSGVKEALTGSPSHPTLQEIAKIHEAVVDNLTRVTNGRPAVQLSYACTGIWHEGSGLRKHLSNIERSLLDTGLFHAVSFYPIDRERLVKLWVSSQAPLSATVPVKGLLPLPKIKDVEEAYLALVPAKHFVDSILAGDDGRIRSAVFDQNVRAYLGDDNPVNTRIREGLSRSEEHDRFAILNNGITIVSPDVRVQSDRISVSAYQIVNGCQTSHVLFRNRSLLSDDVWLPVKVIEAEDPTVVAQVVQATNSQTDVEDAQFLSTRPFVQKLEAYFNSFDNDQDRDRRIFFERRTKQFAGEEIGRARVFTIPKLARAFAAMFLDLPHLAAGYPTQVYKERADQLFLPDHREHAYYTAALALYRLDLSLGNKYVSRKYQGARWHLLMALRYQVAGADMPPLNAKKLDKYCDGIISKLKEGGKLSAAPFVATTKVFDTLGRLSRDRLKGQKSTDDLKSAIGVTRQNSARKTSPKSDSHRRSQSKTKPTPGPDE